MTIAIAVPIRKHLAVIHRAFMNVAVGIISTILMTIWLKGGRSIDSSNWPTISQTIAQRINEAIIGILIPNIFIVFPSPLFYIGPQTLPDSFDDIEIYRITPDRIRGDVTADIRSNNLRDTTRPWQQQGDTLGDVYCLFY